MPFWSRKFTVCIFYFRDLRCFVFIILKTMFVWQVLFHIKSLYTISNAIDLNLSLTQIKRTYFLNEVTLFNVYLQNQIKSLEFYINRMFNLYIINEMVYICLLLESLMRVLMLCLIKKENICTFSVVLFLICFIFVQMFAYS